MLFDEAYKTCDWIVNNNNNFSFALSKDGFDSDHTKLFWYNWLNKSEKTAAEWSV